ncbi:MAG: hypothetical protein LBU76_01010 [Azoarcus sp.]|jgi:hypothetical protein|nr:hypothetical protein [Azoarcus sp.]
MLQKSSFLEEYLSEIITTTFFVALVGAIYVCFFLDWIRYPRGENVLKYCYSPNHEYYITLWQSPWASQTDERFVVGTAKLYDKTGKLLYSNKTHISLEYGPIWGDYSDGRSVVFYQGTEEPGWGYDLPTPSGRRDYSGPSRNCY